MSDRINPTAPGTPVVSNVDVYGNATVTVSASTDNVGVVGYAAFIDGSPVESARSETTTIQLSDLTSGSHSVSVRAFDANNNISDLSGGTGFSVDLSGGVSFQPSSSTIEKQSNTIVILGDSFDARSTVTTEASRIYFLPYGIWRLTNGLMNNKLNIVNVDGISGTGAIQFSNNNYATRVAASVYAFKPKYCGVRASVNDVHEATNSLSDLITAYTDLFTDINNHGIKIITNTIAPSNLIDTPAKVSVWLGFNRWLLNEALQLFDIFVLKQSHQNLLAGSLTAQADTQYVPDGVHPELNGAMRVAIDSAAQLDKIINNPPLIDSILGVGTDDATAMLSNPLNFGIAGTTYTNVTGDVSDNKAISTGATGSAVCTKVTRTDAAGEWQQVVWTPSAAGQVLSYLETSVVKPLNNGVQVGDTVSFIAEVEMDAATVPANSHYAFVKLAFRDAGGTIFEAVGPLNNSIHAAIDSVGWRMVVETPRYAIPVVCTGLLFEINFYSKIAGAMTVRFGRHGLINYSR